MYIISGSKATRVREEEPKEEVAGKRNIRERVKARNALPQNNRRGVSLPTVTRHHATCPIDAFPANCQVIYQGATPHAKVFRAKHLWNTPIPRNPNDNLVVGTSRRDTNSPQIVGGRRYLRGRKRRKRCDREYQPSLDDTPPSPAFISDKMQPKMTALCTLLMFVVVVAVSSLTADAIPRKIDFIEVVIFAINRSIPQSIPILHYARSHESYWDQQDDIDRDEFLEILSRLSRINRPEMENTKRGLDLGLNRGYSGSQAAKHMMGLAAANYAGGPGRRRRSEQA
ncbi:Diuretic hormone class 2 [Trachymyrmex cornetzi]|uniref:Diuretic hormone class 2 n=1 Tax=Trachymyrmex cornetzi TaxID=471704 RepID=A0A195EGN3_9HYME|nr:Diuretic hormone class 2 [Trachymyrmex cornetzi]